jgi:predicted membrane-bound spermidine synthase/tetratricopeptide (TPR) repeat protein
MSHKSTSALQSRLFWLASLLFFTSGGTGLVYQVVWFKRFTHVWGSSSLAFAAVGGSFLFGLGLGAYLLGRSADRAAVPLRWYGVCELLIGVIALLIPFEIAGLVDASISLFAALPEQPLLRYLMQFAITLVVVGPPCVLMGGTLPLLIRQLTSRDGSLDQATGWLYAINTFGAAAGCYLAGFHLLPSFGLLWTNNFAATINILIGLVSLLAAASAERLTVGRTHVKDSAADRKPLAVWSPKLAGLYLATALSGCGALVLEMTWTRQLAVVLGGSTYAYSATLFVVLLGIATGSLVFHAFLRRAASSPALPVIVVGTIVASTLVGLWQLPALTLAVAPESVRQMRADQLGNGLVCVLASCVLELLPAVGMGILFPLFVHLTHASAARVGSAVGNIYAWNTAGSIVGASLTSLLLFPRLGTSGTAALACAMYVVSLLAIMPWRGAPNLLRVGLAAAAGAAAVALVARPIDPRLTNMGLYLYGGAEKYRQAPDEWLSLVHPLFFEEGASCNVFVDRRFPNHLELRVNGKTDASDGVGVATQAGSAYFPRMFKPDAKEVLVIGFGSGCTPGRSLAFPDTRVACWELEPAVYASADLFAHVNGRPQDLTRAAVEARSAALPADERLSPEEIERRARFTIVFGDGRTAVQGSSQKFDLIISIPSNPWMAGCSNLLTREYFRSAREHLTEGGVLAQWIQARDFMKSDYLMIVRTMKSEFPYYGVIELAGDGDTMLVASTRPLMPTADSLAALQKTVDEAPAIKADLESWFGGSDLRWLLLSNYVLDKQQLDDLLASDPSQEINTDLRLPLEFDAPLHLFRKMKPEEMASSVLRTDPAWTNRLAGSLGLAGDTPEFFVELGDYAMRQAVNFKSAVMVPSPFYLNKAQRAYQQALNLEPGHAGATRGMRRVGLRLSGPKEQEPVLRELIALSPDDAVAHAELAAVLHNAKRRGEAVKHYREALRLRPELSFDTRTYTWANNLAWLLATSPEAEIRNGEEAVRWARLACDVAGPNDPEVLDTLAIALAETGQFQEAIKISNKLLSAASDRPALVEQVKSRIKLFEASQPYRDRG